MPSARRLFLAALFVALGVSPVSPQEPVNNVTVYASGGMINSPANFDGVSRTVAYGTGVRGGAGMRLSLYERLAIRSDFAFTFGNGTDTSGGINEEVTLDRRYYGLGVEILLAAGSEIEPYVYGGGGLVSVKRVGAQNMSYAYDVTEFTGTVGGGLRYLFPSNFVLFVEGNGWIYNRASDDSSQFDSSLGAGFGYRFGGN